jgi:hypothetical protein
MTLCSVQHFSPTSDEGGKPWRGVIIFPKGTMSMMHPEKELKGLFQPFPPSFPPSLLSFLPFSPFI